MSEIHEQLQIDKMEDINLDDEKLKKEITEARNELSADRMDISFGEIMNMYERDDLVIDLNFQRMFRWTINQQTRFI